MKRVLCNKYFRIAVAILVVVIVLLFPESRDWLCSILFGDPKMVFLLPLVFVVGAILIEALITGCD